MNRILFEQSETGTPEQILLPLTDRRAEHILKVLRSKCGDSIRVGVIDGRAGNAQVTDISAEGVRLKAVFDTPSPEPWLDLLLAMPRPKVLHRLWAELAAIGFGRIIIVNAAKVEKFYFDNHWLDPESWRPLLVEGLEQAGATRLPEVIVKRAFKPFIQDEIPHLYGNAPKWVAHPRLSDSGQLITAPRTVRGLQRPLLAVGPEGGWTDFELNLMFEAGFSPISLGDRALRTDTACIALAGALAGAFAGK